MTDPKRERARQAKSNSAAAKYYPPKNGTGTGEGLTPLGSPECWCGQPNDHDWPGRVVGTPHPR